MNSDKIISKKEFPPLPKNNEPKELKKKARNHKRGPKVKTESARNKILFNSDENDGCPSLPFINILMHYRQISSIGPKKMLELRLVCKKWSQSILHLPQWATKKCWTFWRDPFKVVIAHQGLQGHVDIRLARWINRRGGNLDNFVEPFGIPVEGRPAHGQRGAKKKGDLRSMIEYINIEKEIHLLELNIKQMESNIERMKKKLA